MSIARYLSKFAALLGSDGKVPATGIATGGVPSFDGIKFPASQVASSDANTLDDYEEGTWTPNTSVNGFNQSVSSLLGKYTKVGRLVTLYLKITLSAAGRPTSYSVFTGLPFASIDDTPISFSSDDASMAQAYGGGYVTGTSLVPSSVAGTGTLSTWLISTAYITA